MIAMMEEEFVRGRQWVTQERFTEGLAVLKALPGPMATQMAIFLGRERGGWRGGIASGVGLILPPFFMILGLGWLYQSGSHGKVGIPSTALTGMQSGALAAIALSVYSMGKGVFQKSDALIRAAVLAAAAALFTFLHPAWEPALIVGAGLFGVAWERLNRNPSRALEGASVLLVIFWVCLKAGLLTFGTGLAILPVLEADFVARYHWLTHQQFLDGVAMGQVSPGPVVIAATFMGYLQAGWAGALAATLGVFVSGFVMVLVVLPRIWHQISGTRGARAFTEWALPMVIGAVAGSSAKLAWMGLTTPVAWGICGAAIFLGVFAKIPSWCLIPGAGLVSSVLSTLG